MAVEISVRQESPRILVVDDNEAAAKTLAYFLSIHGYDIREAYSGTEAIRTAVLFNAGKYAIGVYLAQSAVSSVYGAAGSLAVPLTWLYYESLVFLFGAELTQVYAKRFGSGIIPNSNAARKYNRLTIIQCRCPIGRAAE